MAVVHSRGDREVQALTVRPGRLSRCFAPNSIGLQGRLVLSQHSCMSSACQIDATHSHIQSTVTVDICDNPS